ncbi:hypothetical protein OEZ85_005001 [Tetradesmus obliquus]|uniref:CBM20 domain-containing protein n=1 Tax=Tetradesmus obliquus TaxID=3088 RepID=A0ABY8UIY7_TETOB|nr:hypothetical protein OEZ85_005001 [Tetradesmus obliquus]
MQQASKPLFIRPVAEVSDVAVVRDDACQAGQHGTSSAWQVLPDRGNENSSPSVSSGAAFAALHSTATDVVKVVELRAATAAAEGAVDAAAASPAAAAGVTLPLPASAVPKEAAQQHGALLTQFSLSYGCSFGQHVAVTGSSAQLGCWDPLKAVPLTWHAGDTWKGRLHLPIPSDRPLEYKFIIRNADNSVHCWQDGPNITLAKPGMALAAVAGAAAGNAVLQQLVLDVRDSWDQALHSQRLLPGLRQQQQQQQQEAVVQQQVPPVPDVLAADVEAPVPAAAAAAATPTPDTAAAAVAASQSQRVQFSTQLKLDFGQAVAVLGSCSSLGEWQASRAVQLQWSDGHRWSGTAELPAGEAVKYKYVVLSPDGSLRLLLLAWLQL